MKKQKPQSFSDFVQTLKREDYAFTVIVNMVRHDVYYFEKDGKPGTIAFAIVDGKAIIPLIRVGRITEEEATREIAIAYFEEDILNEKRLFYGD